jgi:N-acetylglucosamine malate deacetylase 2
MRRKFMTGVEPLLGRTLVIVAHPDDEYITYGALLQRMAEPVVAFCTDGAPFDPYFWKDRYGTREHYAEVRRTEACEALAQVGIYHPLFLADDPSAAGRLVDQELFLAISTAYRLLQEIVERVRPSALATLAYEGGHPDHDTCSFMSSLLARQYGIPAFEAPIYHRAHSEGLGVQRFIYSGIPVIDIYPTEEEMQRKRAMCKSYGSQGDFLKVFDIRRESVRPLADYDYRIPPHVGKLNYEAWGWRMTGSDVCAAFSDFLFSWARQEFDNTEATGGSGGNSNLAS